MSLDAQFTFAAYAAVTLQRSVARPESTIRPVQTLSLVPDPMPMYQGYPRSALYWVQAVPAITVDGSIFGDRPAPSEVDLGTAVRFLADDNYWDDIGFVWTPYISNQVGYFFDGGTLTSPTLTPYTYRRGKELFTVNALSFDPGDFLTSSFNSGLDNAISLTISMAVALRQPIPYNFLESDSNNFSVVADEHLELVYNGVDQTVDSLASPAVGAPVYIVMVINPPVVSLYLSYGPGNTFMTNLVTDVSVTNMDFNLGGLTSPASSMDLLEISFDPNPLSSSGVNTLVAAYSSVYGNG